MSTARQITSLPRAGAVSIADQFAIWQGGRTRICDVSDLASFLQIGLKGDKGDKGEKGDKGDSVIIDPGSGNIPADISVNSISSGKYSFTSQVSLIPVTDPTNGDTRIEFRRTNEKPGIYADLLMNRDIRATPSVGQGFGGVSSQVSINNLVGKSDISQWNLLSTLKIYDVGAGQHCASYFQAFRYANNACFVSCMEGRDFVDSPTAGMAAFELDMMGQGSCNEGQRVACDVVFGSATQYGAGSHVVSEGISISPVHGQAEWVPGTTNGFETSTTTGNVTLLNGIRVKGNVVTGLNLTGMNPGFNYQGTRARGVYHSNGLFDVWIQGGEFGFLNEKLVINSPPGGLLVGGTLPAAASGYLLVSIGGLGTCKIPLLPV